MQVIHHHHIGRHPVIGVDHCLDGVDHCSGDAIDYGLAAKRGERHAALLSVDRQHDLVKWDVGDLQPEPYHPRLHLVAHHRRSIHVSGAHYLAAELPPRIVGDRLAIGDGARLAPHRLHPVLGVAQMLEFGNQPRFAEPGLTNHCHDRAHAPVEVVEPLAQ
jgi:hypothetical protein